jgi:hypothetical protein
LMPRILIEMGSAGALAGAGVEVAVPDGVDCSDGAAAAGAQRYSIAITSAGAARRATCAARLLPTTALPPNRANRPLTRRLVDVSVDVPSRAGTG